MSGTVQWRVDAAAGPWEEPRSTGAVEMLRKRGDGVPLAHPKSEDFVLHTGARRCG